MWQYGTFSRREARARVATPRATSRTCRKSRALGIIATSLLICALLVIAFESQYSFTTVSFPYTGDTLSCVDRDRLRHSTGNFAYHPDHPPSRSSASVAAMLKNVSLPKHDPTFTPPLQTRGRFIVDANDQRFKLASVNWYGASDVLYIPGGLERRHRSEIAATIRQLGFNSVRLPYSDEMVLCNPIIGSHLVPANPDLAGKRALDVFEAVVQALTDQGVAVIINNHITHAGWFDGYSLCDATWSNTHLGPLCRISQSEEDWINNWEEMMSRFVADPLVIGADLRNEIHGFWGTMPWSAWAPAAEKASERLLAMNPSWLMIVEGTESANDISGARERPIRLSIPNRVVYSSHVYSWSGWGDRDPFKQRAYSSFVETMKKNWAYLIEQDIAPVWVGEFGAPHRPGAGDLHYWKNLMRYLDDVDADFGYWAINPKKPAGNAYESYGVLMGDWKTPWDDDYRMRDMRELTKDKKDRTPTWEWTRVPSSSR